MKPAFFHLKAPKRNRILEACQQEFAHYDYESASLDRIVETAEISKGGLYEYIASKEELYLFIVQTAYQKLYDYLILAVEDEDCVAALPTDLLQRFRLVSAKAIDFYWDHPQAIAIIVQTTKLTSSELLSQVAAFFNDQFARLFADVSPQNLRYPRDRILELLKDLLLKTRTTFLAERAKGADRETVRMRYLEEWEFLLTILEKGIYQ